MEQVGLHYSQTIQSNIYRHRSARKRAIDIERAARQHYFRRDHESEDEKSTTSSDFFNSGFYSGHNLIAGSPSEKQLVPPVVHGTKPLTYTPTITVTSQPVLGKAYLPTIGETARLSRPNFEGASGEALQIGSAFSDFALPPFFIDFESDNLTSGLEVPNQILNPPSAAAIPGASLKPPNLRRTASMDNTNVAPNVALQQPRTTFRVTAKAMDTGLRKVASSQNLSKTPIASNKMGPSVTIKGSGANRGITRAASPLPPKPKQKPKPISISPTPYDTWSKTFSRSVENLDLPPTPGPSNPKPSHKRHPTESELIPVTTVAEPHNHFSAPMQLRKSRSSIVLGSYDFGVHVLGQPPHREARLSLADMQNDYLNSLVVGQGSLNQTSKGKNRIVRQPMGAERHESIEDVHIGENRTTVITKGKEKIGFAPISAGSHISTDSIALAQARMLKTPTGRTTPVSAPSGSHWSPGGSRYSRSDDHTGSHYDTGKLAYVYMYTIRTETEIDGHSTHSSYSLHGQMKKHAGSIPASPTSPRQDLRKGMARNKQKALPNLFQGIYQPKGTPNPWNSFNAV